MMMSTEGARSNSTRTIAIVTGTRAEYGLLKPVIRAVADHPRLHLQLLVTGTHLLPDVRTVDEIASEFEIAARIEMQDASLGGEGGHGSRLADARATARGIAGITDWIDARAPDVVLVLGDRIEAFAAASAAAIAGIRVAHLHGGDRAPGIADESLRGAITKLAHIHLPATEQSSLRIIAMGEDPRTVYVVGSPAMDGLDDIPALDEAEFDEFGRPDIVMLLHPTGEDDATERQRCATLIDLCRQAASMLALHPNHDAGRDGIVAAIEAADIYHRAHVPRESFIGLLRRVKLLVGNSSAGLIEAAALGTRVIDVGDRQVGRETAGHVMRVEAYEMKRIAAAIDASLKLPRYDGPHPFGEGVTGRRVADLLASIDFNSHPLRKRDSY